MAKIRIDNRKDILLLLLYSPGRTSQVNEPIIGRTRLVKMLFLFKKEALKPFRESTAITEENFYEFFPWNFGPFSVQVYDDLNFFVLRGFVEDGATTEETLPESAAEWEEWVNSSRDDSDDPSLSEYEEREFSLTNKGVGFAESLYAALAREQKELLRDFKRRLLGVSLKALLTYVYETYPDQTARSTIKERILAKRP